MSVNKKEEYKQLFEKIDQEDDGEVYLREVVLFLRAVNEDIDSNLKVKVLLDQYDTNGENILTFPMFCDIMGELEEVGWKKAAQKKKGDITELDIKAIFNLVDVDKSGAVSRREAHMACKLLNKRFGIDNVSDWMKEVDDNSDGKLSYKEFSHAVMKIMKENEEAKNGGQVKEEGEDEPQEE